MVNSMGVPAIILPAETHTLWVSHFSGLEQSPKPPTYQIMGLVLTSPTISHSIKGNTKMKKYQHVEADPSKLIGLLDEVRPKPQIIKGFDAFWVYVEKRIVF